MTSGRETDQGWRQYAIDLGIDPDQPDDNDYWEELQRKRDLIESFAYHQPSPAQVERIAAVRRGHIECAKVIMRNTRVGADQTAALRKLHESMMTANKSIVCEI